MSGPRLVATDLDGTLVRSDGTVSAYAHEVIAALDDRGVPVVFVTGRPLRWAEAVFDYVGAHGLAIVSNGAVVYDVAAGGVREVAGIAPDDGLRLTRVIAEAVPGSSFAIECLGGIRLDTSFVERHRVPEDSPVGPLAELWDEPAVKLLVRHESMEPVEFRERVLAAAEGLASATWSVDGLVEISAAGVTKAMALERLAAGLGVTAAGVVAFGDMPNDLAMLRWAGTSYAMGNAHPSVVEAADKVAPTNDEDGVASVLAGLFHL